MKLFDLLAAAVGVDVLRFFDRSEGDKRERLSFAALENRRAVSAREHAYFATDRSQIFIAAAVHAFLFVEHADAKRFLLHVIEGLRDRELVRFRIFFEHGGFHFFAQLR